MIVFIVGLRRSGTTVFWRNFRQDERFTCFDEPFNPLHREIPRPHFKNTRTELIRQYRKNPSQFKSLFNPIKPLQELSDEFTPAQRTYIQFLLHNASHQHYVVDLTRCHFKIGALHSLFPGSYLIHLHKSPASFASSHLLPSYKRLPRWSRGAKRFVDRFFFFSRRFNFNRWKMEDIIGRNSAGPFPRQVLEDPSFRENFGRAPAVSKLMSYWDILYKKVEKEGAHHFGDRFRSISLEAFCRAPEDVIQSLYQWIDLPYHPLSFNHVKFPSKPYKAGDPRWKERARLLNLEDSSSFLFRYES